MGVVGGGESVGGDGGADAGAIVVVLACVCCMLLFVVSEANLGSVIRYVLGCNQLSCTGHWDAWLLLLSKA